MIKRTTIIILALLLTTSTVQASFVSRIFGGGSGTINTLDQWRSTTSPSTAITQSVYGRSVSLTGLTDGCLELTNSLITSTGVLCGSGGGGGGAGTFSTTTVGSLTLQYPYLTTLVTSLNTSATSTSKWWFDPNTNIQFTSGKIGIGTTSPYAPLSVVGQIVGSNFTATSTTATSTFNGPLLTKTPIADVRAFGAVGDGVTDDTTAIQAALDANRNVYVPNGTYIVSNLTLNNNQKLFGDGASSTLKFKTGSTGFMLEANTSGVLLSYLGLDGGNDQNYSGVASAGNRSALHISELSYNTIIDSVSIHGFDNIGIALNGNASTQRYAPPVISNVNLYRNYVGIDTGYLITLPTDTNGGEYLRITNVDATYNRIGVRIASGNVILNNSIIETNGYGIYIAGIYNNSHGTIVGNLINHNTIYGLYAENSENGMSIIGNQSFYGDWYLNNVTGFNIQGNTFKGGLTNFYLINGGTNYMKGNWFTATTPVINRTNDDFIISDNFYATSTYALDKRDLIVDSNVAYTNGNFGIGTSSPYSKLSVAGQVVGQYFTATSTTNSSTFPYASTTALSATTICLSTDCRTSWPSGGGSGAYPFTPTTNYGVNNQATTGIAWFQNGLNASSTSNFVYASTTAITSTGSAFLATTGGKLAIGTTTNSSNAKAIISGNSYPLLWVYNTGTGSAEADYAGIKFGNPSRSYQMVIGAAGTTNGLENKYYIYDESAGAARLLIDTTGNIGIGTTTPYRKLSVSGGGVFENDVRASYFTATSTTVASTFPYASTTAISATTICLLTDCRTAWPTGGGSGAYPFVPLTNFATLNQATTGIAWFQNGLNASTTSHFDYASTTVISSTGNAYFGGNVGVGTNSPEQLLDLVKNQDGQTQVKILNNSAGVSTQSIFVTSNGTYQGNYGMTGTGYSGYGSLSASTAYLYSSNKLALMADSASNGIIQFMTGGSTEKMRIDTTGNVGIGTTSPYAKLAVTGQIVGQNFAATSTTATSTFAGDVQITGTKHLYTHGIQANDSQGIHLHSNNGTEIGYLGAGGGANITWNGNTNSSGTFTSTSGSANTFPYASTTAISTGYASSTKYFGANLVDCDDPTNSKLLWSDTGVFSCGSDQTGAGGSVDGTGIAGMMTAWFDGNTILATSTIIGEEFIATSTRASRFPYASTTMITSSIASSTTFVAGLGSSGSPSYSFSGSTSGLYLGTDGDLIWTEGGSDWFRFDSVLHNLQSQLVGTAAIPNYSFSADVNTGIYKSWSGDANSLSIAAGGVETFRNSQSSTTVPVGNFGIGTTSPYAKLSVVGPVVAEYFHATSTTATSTISGKLLVSPVIPSTAEINSPFRFGNFITSCEGCGSTGGNILSIANFGGGSPGINTFSARGTTNSPTATQSGDSLYFMGGRGYGTSAWANGSKAVIEFVASENWTDSAQGMYMHFDTTTIGSTSRLERMRITDAGNIGIGTTSPYAKLSVVGQTVAEYFTATSSIASLFPYASTTALSATNLFTNGLTLSGITGSTQCLQVNSSGVVSGTGSACGAGGSSTVGGYAVPATSTTITLNLASYATSTTIRYDVGTANMTINPINATSSLGAWWWVEVASPRTGLIGTTTISYCNWNGQVNPGSNTVNGLVDRFRLFATASTTTGGAQVNYLACDLEGTY